MDRGAAERGVWFSRVRWTVLVGRVSASVALILGGVVVTGWVSWAHSWNMGKPTVICPEPEDVFPSAEIVEVRVSMGWGDGTWCNYIGTDGLGVGPSLNPVGHGERNVFEPRLSFVVSAVVIALVWLVALALVRFVWSLGRLVRRPCRTPVTPVAS